MSNDESIDEGAGAQATGLTLEQVVAVFVRELRQLSSSAVVLIVSVLFLAGQGFFFWAIMDAMADPLQPATPGAVLREFFSGTLIEYLVIFVVLALLSMASFSDEKRGGGLELLVTTPTPHWVFVVGKWLSLVAVFIAVLLPTALLPLYLMEFLPAGKSVELGPIASGYLGLVTVGLVSLSLGVFCSALTSRQSTAALICISSLVLWLLASEWGLLGSHGPIPNLRRSMEGFSRGELSLAIVVRSLGLCAAFVCLSCGRLTVSRKKMMRWGVGAGLYLLIAASLASLCERTWGVFDLSGRGQIEVSQKTLALLHSVEGPVQVRVLMPANQSFTPVYRQVLPALERIKARHGDLALRVHEARDGHLEVAQWAQGAGIPLQDLREGGALIVSAEGGERVIDLLELASFGRDDLGVGTVSNLRVESALRLALRELSESPAVTICVSQGLGEYSSDSFALGLESLREEGATVVVINELSSRTLSACELLLMMGPRASLVGDGLLATSEYLKSGGGLFVALRSQELSASASQGLPMLLKEVGLGLTDERVQSPGQQVGYDNTIGVYSGYGAHPVTAGFEQRRTTLWQRPLRLEIWGDAEPLVQIAHRGRGSAPVMGLSEQGKARVILVGGAESFVAPLLGTQSSANLRLLERALQWSSGRFVGQVDEAEGTELSVARLIMTKNQRRRAWLVCVVILPLSYFVIAIFVWWYRHRRR